MVLGLIIAGLAILIVKSPRRWTGLPLIAGGVFYGVGDAGVLLIGLTWLTFATLLLLLPAQRSRPRKNSSLAGIEDRIDPVG